MDLTVNLSAMTLSIQFLLTAKTFQGFSSFTQIFDLLQVHLKHE